MEYFLHILILIGIYTLLSSSLNLVAGYAGLLSIAHAGFYGVVRVLAGDTPKTVASRSVMAFGLASSSASASTFVRP